MGRQPLPQLPPALGERRGRSQMGSLELPAWPGLVLGEALPLQKCGMQCKEEGSNSDLGFIP